MIYELMLISSFELHILPAKQDQIISYADNSPDPKFSRDHIPGTLVHKHLLS